jgi:hypothetical protein
VPDIADTDQWQRGQIDAALLVEVGTPVVVVIDWP